MSLANFLRFGVVFLLAVTPAPCQPPPPGPRVLEVEKHGGEWVESVAFSPAGTVVGIRVTKIVGTATEQFLTLWDAATGRHLRTYPAPEGSGEGWCFSPDSRLLALPAPGRGEVVLHEVAGGKVIHRLAHPLADSAAFSADGTRLVTYTKSGIGYDGQTLAVWETATGKRIFRVPAPAVSGFNRAELTTRGELLFLGESHEVRVWNAATGAGGPPVKLAGRPTGYPVAACDGRSFVSVVAGRPQLHDRTGAVVRTFGRADERFDYAVFSPDAARVLAAAKSGRVVQWEAATGAEQSAFAVPNADDQFGPSVRFAAGGRYLLVSCSERVAGRTETDPAVAVYTTAGRLLRRDSNIWHVEFDPAGRSVVVVRRTEDAAGAVLGFDVPLYDAAAWLAGAAKK